MRAPRSLNHRLDHAGGVGGLSPRALGLLASLVWVGLVPALAAGPGLATLLDLPQPSGQALDSGVLIAFALGLFMAPLRVQAGRSDLRLRVGLGVTGLAVGTFLALPSLSEAMTGLVAGTGALLWLGALSGGFVDPLRRRPIPGTAALSAAAGARVGAALAWLVLSATGADGWGARAALVGSVLSAWLWDRLVVRLDPVKPRKVLYWVPGLALLVLVPWFDPLLAAVPALGLLTMGPLPSIDAAHAGSAWGEVAVEGLFERLISDPTRALVLTFVVGGLVGAVLLAMPAASGDGVGHRFIDALFTSFSAICVTGLGVLDTPHDFGGFGQVVILLLIQVGGLGIMAFSTAGLVLLGERLSLRHETAAAMLLNSRSRHRLRADLFLVFRVTFACEAAGAVALTILFWLNGDGLLGGLWRGFFTAISAFCNAGFALQSDSLVSYQAAPAILLVIAGLIVAGGLGPVAIMALGQRSLSRVRRPGRPLLGLSAVRPMMPQVRLIVALAAGLCLLPAAFIAVTEWGGTLGHLGVFDRLVNALFQSVTLRTAGFNSIDLTAIHPATYALTIPLMFIGGSPGSTAGGVKTTTMAVLYALVRSAFRPDGRATLLGHQLDGATVRKAAAVATLGTASVMALLLALLLTQPLTLDQALFETVSALGTVGLTIGGTGQLDDAGKLLISLGMLAGRVGPVSLLILLLDRSEPGSRIDPPRLGVDVG